MPKAAECAQYVKPVRDALDLLSGQWKVPLILALTVESRKFNELERLLEGITSRTLSKELKELERNELVQRTVQATVPVTVEYRLTEYGRTLEDVITSLRRWGLLHHERLVGQPRPGSAELFACSGATKG